MMVRNHFLFCSLLCLPALLLSQDRYLSLSSKDSIDGLPKLRGSVGANLKLNGFYDVFGGLQESETFNVGMIDVFGTDDSSSFHMDLYQTQIKLEATYVEKEEQKVYSLVEFDFWGGNGRMRLRKAFVESRHWQIGQNWNNFGDEDIWPNIMEWEGPPSGIWLRTPHIKYSNNFKKDSWIYEISLEAPITNYISLQEIDLDVEEAYQVTPDLTFAIKNKYDWGHIRLSSILRNIRYKFNDQTDNFLGYGLAFSGIYATDRKNNLQFQFVGGTGITAYMTSISGLGYDGYPNIDDQFVSTPAFGGWISYEYFFTPRFHSNVVFGSTKYDFYDVKDIVLKGDEDQEETVYQGDFNNFHFYGIINLMYEPFPRMTIGLELDYGAKEINFEGIANGDFIEDGKVRDAMRISFGFMFYL
ncbi:hypothetical protein [Lutimonas vermicola]|uniref:Uncharacterized protein n=1 Tax=Lutimonas vermicola TaxID=414288 RepID=A0ABU9KZF6_9FLAO